MEGDGERYSRNIELRICEIPETKRGLPTGLWLSIRNYGINQSLASREERQRPSVISVYQLVTLRDWGHRHHLYW